jgi:transposase-like protein
MTNKVPGPVEGLILKPATNGRCTYSENAKQALVELCKQPGVSVAALALAHASTQTSCGDG